MTVLIEAEAGQGAGEPARRLRVVREAASATATAEPAGGAEQASEVDQVGEVGQVDQVDQVSQVDVVSELAPPVPGGRRARRVVARRRAVVGAAHGAVGAAVRRLGRAVRAVRSRGLAPGLAADTGMATAEYAIVTVAAAAFAGLLIVILRSDEVRGLLLGIIRGALSV